MTVSLLHLVKALSKMGMLTPVGLYRIIAAIWCYGINLMMLLKVAERTYGQRIAIVDDRETISFRELLSQSARLSIILQQTYGLSRGRKLGFLCKNHASLVKAIFAASSSGADLYLLNPEMSIGQFNQIVDDHGLDLLVHDRELTAMVEQSSYRKDKVLSYDEYAPAINNLVHAVVDEKQSRQRMPPGKMMLFTGGTTGKAKKAAHQPSLLRYLPPFVTVLTRLLLNSYQTAYIATPLYHGYGVALFLIFIALGKNIVLTSGFEAAKACDLIHKHKVEMLTVVPLMITKMLKHNAAALKSLACIVSGGAELNPKLAAEVFSKVGDVLYNLYGTSEAGLTTIATPQDLRYSAKTIGKKIKHARLHIVGPDRKKLGAGEIGQFCIKNSWSMRNKAHSWIDTGDVGYRDEQGYYFLCGRTDDMVVSAGENVYPIELEQILLLHPAIEDAAVIGIRDDLFGQRLKAVIQPAPDARLTKDELLNWLRPRVARYQMPKEIVFVDQIPYTQLGKRDKKGLESTKEKE
ncbi:MAG: AMP-binding protein [Clostridia bacterium]